MANLAKLNKEIIEAKAIDLYYLGYNQTAIAKEIGYSQTGVGKLLRRRGITEFKRGSAARDQRGDKNPFWKGGVSRSNIRRLTKKLLDEAGINQKVCEVCGAMSETRLNIHHKDHNRSHNTLDNLIVLCATCHSRHHDAERDRDSLGRFARG